MLLTLLTAGLVGTLALSLLKRHVEQQEIDYLTANANAAARQATALIWPLPQPAELQRLAQTSAFLGNARVRILDDQQHVLADSGARSGPDTFVWVLTPDQLNVTPGDIDTPFIMSLLFSRRPYWQTPRAQPSTDMLPPGTKYMVVQRDDGPWGRRFIFEASLPAEAATTGAPANSDNRPGTGEYASSTNPTTRVSNPARSERTISVPIGSADSVIGSVELSGAPDFSAETFGAAAQAVLFAAVGASLAAGVVALFISRSLTAPLNNLTLVAGQMGGGDLSARAPVTGDDETGQLARQFNRMAERLQVSFADLGAERDTLRRFIADASHELRTPITALKTFNELLQSNAGDDRAARTEFLSESQTQIERLEWITRNLLDLSRLDAGVAGLELAEHDAGELVQEAAAAFRPFAQAQGITLTLALPQTSLLVRCDRARIEIALSNLIDNALKYTPAGGHVDVGAAADEAGVVRLWVQDDGRGIDTDELPYIFERFYRGKGAGASARGSGLGLALVKSVVQAHGGHVTVQSEPGHGSRFVIELPAR
jgi:signal transduction histidine kinase